MSEPAVTQDKFYLTIKLHCIGLYHIVHVIALLHQLVSTFTYKKKIYMVKVLRSFHTESEWGFFFLFFGGGGGGHIHLLFLSKSMLGVQTMQKVKPDPNFVYDG